MQVSVIIATYNRAQLLPMILARWKEVLSYTRYKFELIFSDDGSSDNTIEILENCADLPIMILTNTHGGASKARNHALARAKGELIIFTGDDIFPQPDFINKHYECYLQNGSKKATLGRIYWHPDIHVTYLMKHVTEVGSEQFGFANMKPYSEVDFRFFYTSNISIARHELGKVGYFFDESFEKCCFEDTELGYRLWKNGVSIFYSPDILAFHYHVYDSIPKFIDRQLTAGEMLATFKRLHPELSMDEIKFDINGFSRGYKNFISQRGASLVAYLGIGVGKIYLKSWQAKKLEFFINKYNCIFLQKYCSKLYSRIFAFYFFVGLAHGLDAKQDIKRCYLYASAYLSKRSPYYYKKQPNLQECATENKIDCVK